MREKPIFSGARAKNYTFRPQWTLEHVSDILEEAKLPANPVIIDLGSGTGQFTQFILRLQKDATVYAVEPSDDMRNQAQKALAGNPNFFSVKADAFNFSSQIPNKADLIVASQAAHWWSPPRINEEQEAVVIKNLQAVSKARTAIAYAYYNLGFADQRSDVGEDIHQSLKEFLPSYGRNQTELSNANAFEADRFSSQIAGIQTSNAELSPMQHTRTSFFDWLQSYSFVDNDALAKGTSLRAELEATFNKHVNKDGTVTIPIFAKTHMGFTPS